MRPLLTVFLLALSYLAVDSKKPHVLFVVIDDVRTNPD